MKTTAAATGVSNLLVSLPLVYPQARQIPTFRDRFRLHPPRDSGATRVPSARMTEEAVSISFFTQHERSPRSHPSHATRETGQRNANNLPQTPSVTRKQWGRRPGYFGDWFGSHARSYYAPAIAGICMSVA